MANCIYPDQHFIVLFAAFVFGLFCCRVSCVLLNVTRDEQDIVSYFGVKDCTKFCLNRNAFVYPGCKRSDTCSCQCLSDYKTFVVADMICTADKNLRNTKKSSLDFQLYQNEQPDGRLEIIPFDSNSITILFHVRHLGDNKKCNLDDIEELSQKNAQEWDSVKLYLNYKNKDVFELDDDDIETKYKWINIKYEGWMMLKLNWKVNPDRFVGFIMRLNVTCGKGRRTASGSMVFKVNGTFTVPGNTVPSLTLIPGPTTSYFPTPMLSIKSTVYLHNSTTMLVQTPVFSTMTSSLLSPSHQDLMSSSHQDLMSSSHQPMTSLPVHQTETSSTSQPITSTTQPIISTTSSVLSSSSHPGTKRFSHSLTSSIVQISSSVVFSSSSIIKMGPATASKSSSSAAVTGGVIAGILVLLFMFVFFVYIIRKRKWKFIREKKLDLGNLNPNYRSSYPSLQVIPALNNPLNDGVYENPEAIDDGVNRQSGIPSFESAAYDACIIVENPAANREVKSVYDNIPDRPENTYKTLDPTKREPSAKYQSLVNPENEPLYSEIDRLPSPVPIRNDLGLKAPTPPPFTPRKSHHPVVTEPIYNELESSGERERTNELTGPAPPPLAPRKIHTPTVTEPVYSVLEDSKKTEEPQDVSPSLPPRKSLTQQHLRPTPERESSNKELEKSHNKPQESEEKVEHEDVYGLEESIDLYGKNGR